MTHEFWIESVWRASWQGGIALALVWCICRFAPRISPAFKVWLWRLALLKLLVALFWGGSIELPLLAPHREEPIATEPLSARNAVPVIVVDTMNKTIQQDQPSFTATGVLFVLWLAGMLVGACRLGYQWRQSALLKRNSSPLANDTLRKLCAALGIRRVPALLQSDAIRAPMLAGIVRPEVILPREVRGDALSMMLAHELAHVKRRDLLWAWLPAICHTLFFFHPLLWLSRREWLLAQEMACDELALRHSGAAPAAYGNMLVDLLAAPVPKPRFGALGICENSKNLKRRILNMKTIDRQKSRWLMVTLLMVSVGATLPLRIVAQDKPEDATKRIQQLERENANLRAELDNLRQTPGARKPADEELRKAKSAPVERYLATEIVAAEVELAALRTRYTDGHPQVEEATTRLKKLKELQAVEKSRTATTKERAVRERELYLEELALAQKYADSMQRQVQVGRAAQEEFVRAQRQVFGIQREIAKLEANRARLKEVLQEEMEAVQRLLKEARKQVEVGRASVGHDLDLQRELLKLKRELLTLEEQ